MLKGPQGCSSASHCLWYNNVFILMNFYTNYTRFVTQFCIVFDAELQSSTKGKNKDISSIKTERSRAMLAASVVSVAASFDFN